ncbi:MAG: lysophospholipid acyltransferase family protein [Pseudomonadota bacterium]
MISRIRKSPFLRALAAALGVGYLRLMDATVRWRIEGGETRARVQAGRGRWIIPVWHGRLMGAPCEKTKAMRVWALISANRDGDIIAQAVARFGAPSIRGSSRDPRKPDKDKRGRAAAQEAARVMSEETDAVLVLTPDGPRGPRMHAQPGVATIAIAARAPVAPYAYATRRAIMLKTWDRFLIPLPFDRGVKVWGDPLEPPEDDSAEAAEAFRAQVEAAMLEVTERADRLAGREPVRPGAPREA